MCRVSLRLKILGRVIAMALAATACAVTQETSAPRHILSGIPPLTHGEPPHRELQRYDYTCATGRYQLVIEQTMSPDRSQKSVTIKTVSANGRPLPEARRRRLAEAFAEYADLSRVNVSCWPSAIQVFVEGRRQQSGDLFQLYFWVSEEGLGRIELVEGAAQ